MINSLKIGPVTYQVKLKDDLHTLDDQGRKQFLHGHMLYDDAEIRVNNEQADDVKVCAVWHEALHAILNNAGQDAPEAVIIALGYGLVQLLRENPQLVDLTLNR